jgi:hypothetical protein
VSCHVRNMLLDTGALLGLAGIVYLLAPPGEEWLAEEEPGEEESKLSAPV